MNKNKMNKQFVQ